MSSENWQFIDGEGDTFHVKKTFDTTPILESAAALRSADITTMGESWHIGRIDARLVSMWLKEAGVLWSDTGAAQEVLRKKLMDGDNSKFRIHGGTI